MIHHNQDKEISYVDTVFQIPTAVKTKESLNVTLFYPSPSLACLSDGCGKLFLLHTEGQNKGHCTKHDLEGSNHLSEWSAITYSS